MTEQIDDSVRWQAALTLAGGRADLGAQKMFSRRKWLIGLRTTTAVIGAAGIVALFVANWREVPLVAADWRTITGPVLLILGVLVEMAFVALTFRSSGAAASGTPVDVVLRHRQRVQLRRQMRRQERVSPELVPLIQLVAERAVRRRFDRWFALGGLLVVWGNIVGSTSPELWTFGVVALLVFVRYAITAVRDNRCARMFLTLYPLDRDTVAPEPVERFIVLQAGALF